MKNIDIFSEIRNSGEINQINSSNTVIAIAHIFHHSKETSICGIQDMNFKYKIDITKKNKQVVDKNHLDLIRYKNK